MKWSVSNPLRNVRRHDHHYFHGWVVTLTRHERRRARHFNDGDDGPAESLRRALLWRDELERSLPPPVKLKRTFTLNPSGVMGVTRVVERTASGSVLERWIATWPTIAGRRKRSFSVDRYGEEGARRKAIDARRRGVAEYIAARARQIAA